MARSIQTIYDEIIEEKDAKTELAALNSPSNTAIFKLWAMVIATVLYIHEVLWDLFKAELQTIADRAIPGTLAWWAQKVREYQHGDLLTFQDNVYQYNPVDESKRIVKKVSVNDDGRIVRIKAAKLTGETVTVLSAPELDGLKDYTKQIRFAGTALLVESLNPDKLLIEMDVYYDGQADLVQLKLDTEAAIKAFISNIPFDGVLYRNKLIDAVQAVEGVIDLVLLTLQVKVGTLPYQDIERNYQAASGYFEIDPDYPLDTTINYINE